MQRLLDPRAGRDAEVNLAKRQELVQAKVAAAAGKLGQSLRPSDEQELGKIRLEALERRLPAGAGRRRLLTASSSSCS